MSFQLEGRTAVVFGVANKRSIAWSIAQGLHAAGAQAGDYVSERASGEGSQGPDPSFPVRKASCATSPKTKKSTALFAHSKERYGKLHASCTASPTHPPTN